MIIYLSTVIKCVLVNNQNLKSSKEALKLTDSACFGMWLKDEDTGELSLHLQGAAQSQLMLVCSYQALLCKWGTEVVWRSYSVR